MQNKFLDLIREQEPILKNNTHSFKIIGHIKLLLCMLVVINILLLFSQGFTLAFFLLFVILLIVSAAFWIYHAKIMERIDYSNSCFI